MAEQRRLRSGSAAKRGASARQQQETVAGRTYTNVAASHKGEVYHETSSEEEILHTRFAEGEHPAFVKFSAGMTINLGNFESLRIDCGVTLPCRPADIEATHQIASDFVAERVAEEETNWLGQSKAPQQAKRGR